MKRVLITGANSYIGMSFDNWVNKAFGNMSYDQSMSQYDFDYIVADLKTSIKRTEG